MLIAVTPTLNAIVAAVRGHSGLEGKRAIAAAARHFDCADPVHGPGDDGAVVPVGSQKVIACGEAILPRFVQSDPFGAGIAAVVANVNDVAAMGGVPLGIVNTIVAPPRIAAEVMRGLKDAASMYDVPIIGGHYTEVDAEASLSAFAVGHAEEVLSIANTRPRQKLLLACSLDGRMRPDFPFFTSIEPQRDTLARDIRLLAEVAARGLARAARDVSMAGPLGSLLMLLEFTRHGATIDMRKLPVPTGVDPLRWAVAFPTYAFWLTVEAGREDECADVFRSKGLACVEVGEVAEGSEVTLVDGAEHCQLIDLSAESVTGLWGPGAPGSGLTRDREPRRSAPPRPPRS